MTTRLFLFSLVLVAGCWNAGCGSSTEARQNGRDHDPDTIERGDMARDVHRVEEMLRGQVAGVQVRQTPSGLVIRIRGEGTPGLSSDDPLFIIDGLPIELGARGALVGINPGDIESIRVLKDVTDTAIYGSRGANGVIIISTFRPPTVVSDTLKSVGNPKG